MSDTDPVVDYHLQRATRAFGQKEVPRLLERIKAIVGDRRAIEEHESAAGALRKLRSGERPSPSELASLELVIRLTRPAPISVRGELPLLQNEAERAFPYWHDFRDLVKPYLYSIGRIDAVRNLTRTDPAGTGFLVADQIVLTNKHVVNQLSRGTGELERGQGVVLFKHEYDSPDEDPVPILNVIMTHATLDIALLEVDRVPSPGRPSFRLDPVAIAIGDPVVAVGYPVDDSARNPLFASVIFENKFGVKRAAPGEITGISTISVYHDCSTLGGNSGSPILSMKTGAVLAIQREGFFVYRNEAIPTSAVSDFVPSRSSEKT